MSETQYRVWQTYAVLLYSLQKVFDENEGEACAYYWLKMMSYMNNRCLMSERTVQYGFI